MHAVVRVYPLWECCAENVVFENVKQFCTEDAIWGRKTHSPILIEGTDLKHHRWTWMYVYFGGTVFQKDPKTHLMLEDHETERRTLHTTWTWTSIYFKGDIMLFFFLPNVDAIPWGFNDKSMACFGQNTTKLHYNSSIFMITFYASTT